MAETMHAARLRRLPSVDWLAFGVGVVATGLQYVWPPAAGFVLLAVVLPSLLREVGLLKDADELTRGVMHRAGFHALLVLAFLIGLNKVLLALGLFDPRASQFGREPFPPDTLRMGLVLVFVISYLIQYWGARGGVVRVLLGAAGLTLMSLTVLLRPQAVAWPGTTVAVIVGTAVAFVLLALLVRRRPRLGGGVLLAIFLAALLVMVRDLGRPRVGWALVTSLFQIALIFGVTGVALLRETATKESDL